MQVNDSHPVRSLFLTAGLEPELTIVAIECDFELTTFHQEKSWLLSEYLAWKGSLTSFYSRPVWRSSSKDRSWEFPDSASCPSLACSTWGCPRWSPRGETAKRGKAPGCTCRVDLLCGAASPMIRFASCLSASRKWRACSGLKPRILRPTMQRHPLGQDALHPHRTCRTPHLRTNSSCRILDYHSIAL